ncbi:unnamed protein product, partial [marine sediment metagenome]
MSDSNLPLWDVLRNWWDVLHGPTIRWGSNPVHQYRPERYERDYELVSDFETLADWVPTGADPVANDTDRFKEGNQGIRWTIDGNLSADRTIDLNALGKHFTLWVYVDDVDNKLVGIHFYFQVNNNWATLFDFNIDGTVIGTILEDGWNRISLVRGDFVRTGVVDSDWANITMVRNRVDSVPG